MIDPSQIKEHMDVVGSDGQHVGTVDHLCVKLTERDPSAHGQHHSAHGQHHVANLDVVASVDGNTLKLVIPASEAMQQGKVLEE